MLAPWKESYDQPAAAAAKSLQSCLTLCDPIDSILKSRDTALSTKVRLVKAMVFPVVMYGCESWTIKLSAEELMLLNCGVGEDS